MAYGGADWLSEHHSFRVRLHLGIDLSVPFVPAMTIFYLSLNVLLWCAPFVLRSRRELLALSVSLASATLVAAIFFVLLPGQQAYAPPQDHELGDWAGIYHFACWLAMTHNYLPSLHVAFTTIAIAVYRDHAKRWGRILLGVWGLAIISSTMLIHQHYLVDVVSGILLGWLAVRWIYRPLLARRRRLPMDETPPANHPTYQELPA